MLYEACREMNPVLPNRRFIIEPPKASQEHTPNLTKLPIASQPAWICHLSVFTQTRENEIKWGVRADPVEIRASVRLNEANATDKVKTEHLEDILADVIDQFAKIRDCDPDSMEGGISFDSRIALISEKPLTDLDKPILEEVKVKIVWDDPRYFPGSEGLRPFMLRFLMIHLELGKPSRLHTGFY
jgi:hypothetical protein